MESRNKVNQGTVARLPVPSIQVKSNPSPKTSNQTNVKELETKLDFLRIARAHDIYNKIKELL